MRIAFYDNCFDNIGLQIIISLLKQEGHIVDVMYDPGIHDPLNIEKKALDVELIADRILDKSPELVGFSAYTNTYSWYREIASKVKSKNPEIFILFGGIHTTLLGKKTLTDPYVDFAIIGEGEDAIIELVDCIKGKGKPEQINNLCYRDVDGKVKINQCRPYIKDLDRLPFPDKREYVSINPLLGIRYQITTSRGCFYSCSYCSNNKLHDIYGFEKKHVRQRSPENVIAELEYAMRQYPIKAIYFVDEVFTHSVSWLEQFVKLYKQKIGLPIDCVTHPLFINESIAKLLKELNVKFVDMGVQTANEDIRKSFLKRKESNSQVKKAVGLLRKNGIKVALDHILGLPGEDFKDIKYSIISYSDWKPSCISINWLVYYPGLYICEIAHGLGAIDIKELEMIDKGTHENNYKNIKIEQRTLYLKYRNVMKCVGLLPSGVVQFLANHVSIMPSSNWMALILNGLSVLLIQRKKWVFPYLWVMCKMKIRLWYQRTIGND